MRKMWEAAADRNAPKPKTPKVDPFVLTGPAEKGKSKTDPYVSSGPTIEHPRPPHPRPPKDIRLTQQDEHPRPPQDEHPRPPQDKIYKKK